MIFLDEEILLEEFLLEDNADEKREQDLQRKLRLSKIKSLNQQLTNLLQKKIRIDLEVKRTKKKLTKLQSQSKTDVKLKLNLEDSQPLTKQELRAFLESASVDERQEITDILSQISLAGELIQEVDRLPLFEE